MRSFCDNASPMADRIWQKCGHQINPQITGEPYYHHTELLLGSNTPRRKFRHIVDDTVQGANEAWRRHHGGAYDGRQQDSAHFAASNSTRIIYNDTTEVSAQEGRGTRRLLRGTEALQKTMETWSSKPWSYLC